MMPERTDQGWRPSAKVRQIVLSAVCLTNAVLWLIAVVIIASTSHHVTFEAVGLVIVNIWAAIGVVIATVGTR